MKFPLHRLRWQNQIGRVKWEGVGNNLATGLLCRRNSLLLARTLKGALLGLGVGIISILQVSANRRLIVVELDRCIDDALNSV